ncbi:DUF1365 domain-containing protein [Alsobacter soli]|uniref:DUF1365 domain-containing protein n=1 Tax=Alsobacter soli TaxID=2109933 RepID=A0A2T1HVZ3_9HYPH|nr:DUF1365 domain-containing protein [Alsobacter soli]PSC05824.1 DUF1365 domain-containing protein [Alsobacter soli]
MTFEDRFRPPEDAASLYIGSVMHARLKPTSHRFTYRVFSMALDLDRLADASRSSWLFSVGRWNLVSFRERDHGPRDGSALRPYVDQVLARAGLPRPARVLLLCYPRILGFGFNPLSVYFAYGDDGALSAVLYEVRNTFGQHHTYACPVRPGEFGPEGLRQERRKLFYVSPFNDMAMTYRFRIRPPGFHDVAVRILECDQAGPLLAATFHGRHSRLTTGSLLAALARVPLLTLSVVGGIHWEAFRLWWKGMRLRPRPAPPPPVSFPDGQQSATSPSAATSNG